MAHHFYTDMGAIFSSENTYRYLLWREWRSTRTPPATCLFIMLNPSTANGETDDATIRKCVSFSKRWGYERMIVANLFAFRATDPSIVLALHPDRDPVGFENQYYIERAACEAERIICAWGVYGAFRAQDETVLGWLPPDKPRYALGLTKRGFPPHPLYVPYERALVRYKQDTLECV